MRDACIPAANGHMTAKALATLYDNFLGSLGLSSNAKVKTSSSGRRHVVAGPSTATAAIAPAKPPPLLCRARVNEMRAYQVSGRSAACGAVLLVSTDLESSVASYVCGKHPRRLRKPLDEMFRIFHAEVG